MSSFTLKGLTAIITLGAGTFAGGATQVTLTGLRIIANIDKAGGVSMGTARFKIYGMLQADMNQLTMIAFHPLQNPNNKIQIIAIDDGNESTVYSGTIISAWAEYGAAPEVYLTVSALTGYFSLINPVAPTSYKTGLPVSKIMGDLAKLAGFTLENNGVTAVLPTSYFPGTALEQIKECAKAANIDYYLDDDTLAICPKGLARNTPTIPLMSKDTGMVGYPSFDRMGISFSALYNPALRFGGLVTIKSDVLRANGTWRIVSVAHDLESLVPDGKWFTHIWCTDNALTVIK